MLEQRRSGRHMHSRASLACLRACSWGHGFLLDRAPATPGTQGASIQLPRSLGTTLTQGSNGGSGWECPAGVAAVRRAPGSSAATAGFVLGQWQHSRWPIPCPHGTTAAAQAWRLCAGEQLCWASPRQRWRGRERPCKDAQRRRS